MCLQQPTSSFALYGRPIFRPSYCQNDCYFNTRHDAYDFLSKGTI